MTIYNTGTVSVTNGNAVVTGSGTAWAVALISGGIFSSAGVSVPILSVGSDTSLTLAYAWPGTTASGAVYAIARENSEAADIVNLNDRLSQVLVKLSLVGITPDASGTLTERDALTLAVGDKGFLFLHAELGSDFEFYRWSGSAWIGPFATRGVAGVGDGGYGLPAGGTAAQFLRKSSGADGDSAWASALASEVSNDSSVSGSKVKDALDALSSSIATAAANVGRRGTVRAATTANIAIATALNSGDTIDGVVLATGDLVLVKSQTAPAENGIYGVGVTPARSSEYDTYNEHPGALIVVQEGTTLAESFWYCTSNVGGTLGTTAINFSQMTISLADDSVTNAKLANMANATIKGRSTAGTGDPEDLTAAQVRALIGGTSGSVFGLLNGNNTYSGTSAFTGGFSTSHSTPPNLVTTGVAGGAPAASGTTDANQFLTAGNGGVQWRFGFYFNGMMWSQPCLASDYASNFGTVFCPNGGNVGVGDFGSTGVVGTKFTVSGPFATLPPSIVTTSYTVAALDDSVICNGAGAITLTLPAAAAYPGRWLTVKTIVAQAVNSASSNVKPIGTNTAGTAILAATTGKWAILRSDGANWVIMAAN
ncbi:hypothetical protein [Mesorhizobium sp. M1A.F.Ca.ET.072.01.1.1]|uniref:hypothetical protein n=1 Tax=Mesorhizobium sp. M1A.F.Ca.ET.072.01.1.1 TaxID=2496753 RepID=UPI001FDFA5F5|nr:hypothetical protein [Mesorhizobium sp. M1A.F.Ca.ET.072.01.1.1]